MRRAKRSNIISKSHLSRWELIIYSVLNFIFSILIILFEKNVPKFSGCKVSLLFCHPQNSRETFLTETDSELEFTWLIEEASVIFLDLVKLKN